MSIFDKRSNDNSDGICAARRAAKRQADRLRHLALVVLFVFSLFIIRVTRIEAGHVGVEINLAGNQRGASEIPIRTGWVVYSPLKTQIFEFPRTCKR